MVCGLKLKRTASNHQNAQKIDAFPLFQLHSFFSLYNFGITDCEMRSTTFTCRRLDKIRLCTVRLCDVDYGPRLLYFWTFSRQDYYVPEPDFKILQKFFHKTIYLEFCIVFIQIFIFLHFLFFCLCTIFFLKLCFIHFPIHFFSLHFYFYEDFKI